MSVLPREGRWIEPFMGTGVVGFNSGFYNAVLSDINPHIIRFYQALRDGGVSEGSVREYLERESVALSGSGDGQQRYREVRERFNKEGDPHDFLFLSRACFNGLMRFNRKGGFNVPFCKKPERFSKAYIAKIANQVKAVSLICKGWEFNLEGFRDSLKRAGEGDVVYCDPPYSGRNSDYFSSWSEEDDDDLIRCLSETKAKVAVSSWHHDSRKDNPFIRKFGDGFTVLTKEHFYHVSGKAEGRSGVTEALIINFIP